MILIIEKSFIDGTYPKLGLNETVSIVVVMVFTRVIHILTRKISFFFLTYPRAVGRRQFSYF